MVQSVKNAADAVLNKAVNSTPGVPGVVAVATDRNANITRAPSACARAAPMPR